MAESRIPVDLFNPGQVFACMGFLEAAEVLLGEAEGGFDWEGVSPGFRLRTAGEENPIATVLEFLAEAQVRWLSPSEDLVERDGGPTIVQKGISQAAEPDAAYLPAEIVGRFNGQERSIAIGYWADGTSRFSTVFKKSTNGASSHVRFENAMSSIRLADIAEVADDPLGMVAWTLSLFRLDPRGSVSPIHAGFSPDSLRKGGINMRVATYPICEALAVIGLEHARPKIEGQRRFRYCAWSGLSRERRSLSGLLSPELARAGLNGALPFMQVRHFVVEHDEVKKGGDRAITRVSEEKT